MNLVFPSHTVLKQARIQMNRVFTDKELMAFSEEAQGFQVEWYGKERMLVMSPPGSRASAVAIALAMQVSSWAKARGNGRVYGADGGFRLYDNSILSPDVAWVSKSQLAALSPEETESFFPLCPELVIEVKSPSDSIGYLRKKCRRWIAAGAKVSLLVDGEKRSAELFLSNEGHRVPTETTVALPGFDGLNLDLAEAWEDDLDLGQTAQ